jgi:WD40 repeat protein
MFCAAEVRLHWFEFEDELKVNANGIELKNNPPLQVEYNQMHDELVVTTKSDIRLIDMNTGQIKQILANLVNPEEELTLSRLYTNHKKLLICDNKGALKTRYYPNGQGYTNNIAHNQEITNVYVDFHNKLILSTAWDSSIYLQQEKQKNCKVIRSVKNAHIGQEINCVAVEIRLGLFATASSGTIFIWDYESFKLMGACSN